MSRVGGIARRVAGALPPERVLLRGRGAPDTGVAVTFDDGPHREHTPLILDLLDEAGAKATFFVQGDQAAALPHLVREVHGRGHQLGNHAYSHASVRRIGSILHVAEVQRTQRLLEDITGERLPRCYRPPFGDWSLLEFAWLTMRRYQFVFWSMDSDDSNIRDADSLVAHVTNKEPTAGEIMLFHEDYPQTVAALPRVLEQLAVRGLSPVRVRDLRGPT
ncbi:MAG: polysaccharide deacetylase family protein [Steroidobacteraceae bacterium]